MEYRLLVVEDDDRLRAIVCDYFVAKGFRVAHAADGAQALEALGAAAFDIVFSDIMMPNIDGFTVCRELRAAGNTPVIFVTARSREDDQLFGYELGADDYMTKPFSLPLLHAKALALIKRAHNGAAAYHTFDGLTVDTNRRAVTVDQRAVTLAPKEYELLVYLIRNKGIVLSRERILNGVWGYDHVGDIRVVDTHIKKLRKALGTKACAVRTIIKGGYCFDLE